MKTILVYGSQQCGKTSMIKACDLEQYKVVEARDPVDIRQIKPDIIIHMIEAGRIDFLTKDNKVLNLHSKKHRIPFLLIVNKCENHEPMQHYIDENRDCYIERGIRYNRALASCFFTHPKFYPFVKEKVNESIKLVTTTIYELLKIG